MGCLFSKETDGEVDINWIKENARTGDIILVSGKSLFSLLIKAATFSRWSHVGVIVRLKRQNSTLKSLVQNEVYVLQSIVHSESEMHDVLDRDLVDSGVQLNRIEDVLRVERGKIYYRQLLDTGPGAVRYINKTNSDFIKYASRKQYENDLSQLINSVLALNHVEDPSSYFCSEIVADFYFHMGFASRDGNTIPNNFTPASFGKDAAYPIVLQKGYMLGDIFKIVEAY